MEIAAFCGPGKFFYYPLENETPPPENCGFPQEHVGTTRTARGVSVKIIRENVCVYTYFMKIIIKVLANG